MYLVFFKLSVKPLWSTQFTISVERIPTFFVTSCMLCPVTMKLTSSAYSIQCPVVCTVRIGGLIFRRGTLYNTIIQHFVFEVYYDVQLFWVLCTLHSLYYLRFHKIFGTMFNVDYSRLLFFFAVFLCSIFCPIFIDHFGLSS